MTLSKDHQAEVIGLKEAVVDCILEDFRRASHRNQHHLGKRHLQRWNAAANTFASASGPSGPSPGQRLNCVKQRLNATELSWHVVSAAVLPTVLGLLLHQGLCGHYKEDGLGQELVDDLHLKAVSCGPRDQRVAAMSVLPLPVSRQTTVLLFKACSTHSCW